METFTGRFVSFQMPYRDQSGVDVPAGEQAATIAATAERHLESGPPGVLITYSANYGQTRKIVGTYLAGGWSTETNGANQAEVMEQLELLLGGSHQHLQGRLRIAPITTLNAYSHPVPYWNADVLFGIVTSDLDRIGAHLEAGWVVLGWQNQDTIGRADHPYAVGGGVAALPRPVSSYIQQRLMEYAAEFPAG